MFHDDDRIVHIPALDQVVLIKVLYLMEEYESAARSQLGSVIRTLVPASLLNTQNLGSEIDRQFDGRSVGRSESDV